MSGDAGGTRRFRRRKRHGNVINGANVGRSASPGTSSESEVDERKPKKPKRAATGLHHCYVCNQQRCTLRGSGVKMNAAQRERPPVIQVAGAKMSLWSLEAKIALLKKWRAADICPVCSADKQCNDLLRVVKGRAVEPASGLWAHNSCIAHLARHDDHLKPCSCIFASPPAHLFAGDDASEAASDESRHAKKRRGNRASPGTEEPPPYATTTLQPPVCCTESSDKHECDGGGKEKTPCKIVGGAKAISMVAASGHLNDILFATERAVHGDGGTGVADSVHCAEYHVHKSCAKACLRRGDRAKKAKANEDANAGPPPQQNQADEHRAVCAKIADSIREDLRGGQVMLVTPTVVELYLRRGGDEAHRVHRDHRTGELAEDVAACLGPGFACGVDGGKAYVALCRVHTWFGSSA